MTGRDPAEPAGVAVASLGLRLLGEAGRPLSKAQKKFDRLLRKVEALRQEKQRETLRCERFLKLYQAQIHPEEQRLHRRRKELVLLLAAAWHAPKGLGLRQREQLEDLLKSQLQELLLTAGPDVLDQELKALLAELYPHGEVPEAIDAVEDESSVPPGTDGVEKEAGSAATNEGGPGADRASRPKPARAQAAEDKALERAAARDQARKRTVVSIYKQLAKVLHPDLEQDPALRERKHRLMQNLTKAYREGDLHTLLRLELEWISREEGDLARLGDEKLGIYCELLEEQIEELETEIRDLPCAPRFSAVGRFAHPLHGFPADIGDLLRRIRELSTSLKLFRDALAGPRGREELRETLRQLGAQRRQQARREGFDDRF